MAEETEELDHVGYELLYGEHNITKSIEEQKQITSHKVMATTMINNLEPNSRSSNLPLAPRSVAHRSFKHIQHTQYQIPQINYPKRNALPPNTSLLTQFPPADPQTFPKLQTIPSILSLL